MMKCIVLITILISLAHVTRGVHLRSKINAVKTLKNNVQIEQNVQNTQNVYTSNAHRVGGWGGLCTCPDGQKYYVGDNYDSNRFCIIGLCFFNHHFHMALFAYMLRCSFH